MTADNSLQRFLTAQETDYALALAEVKAGRKRSHWMWCIFPQIQGLGFSETSKLYAIKDRQEAGDYLKHPVLGGRLISIGQELLKLDSSDATRIFGSPDDLKLKSSMTLFAAVGSNPVFQAVLDRFFRGAPDNQTLQLLGKQL
ncbi:DUF1810 domain-containing protein [Hymenobacter fastidiosus]|uniref:DUF1810 domain-containing protein n=1 Tax=Hymenobacter fastidiosus TaxID=486264 RepID=A0ABP7SGB0_9BACT